MGKIMWYSVLKQEVQHRTTSPSGTLRLHVAGVYQVKRYQDPVYGLETVRYRSVDINGWDEDSQIGQSYGQWFEVSAQEARNIFTRPTQDLNSAIEESFLVSEATFC